MVAWIVLIFSCLILLGLLALLATDDWKTFLISFVVTALLIGSAVGLAWSIEALFG